jgi:predicted nucleotidyltransferase
MPHTLPQALSVLREHEPELRRRGVLHAAVFGSVARGEAGEASDVDVLVDLDPGMPLGLFEYVDIKLFVASRFGVDSLEGPVDVVNRATLKERLRPDVLREAVRAF